jgi:hypothetical protein
VVSDFRTGVYVGLAQKGLMKYNQRKEQETEPFLRMSRIINSLCRSKQEGYESNVSMSISLVQFYGTDDPR